MVGCESCGFWESNPGPLQIQVLLTLNHLSGPTLPFFSHSVPDTVNLLHRNPKSPVDPDWPLLSLANTTLLTLAAVVVGTGAPRRRWKGVGRWARAQSSNHLHDIGHDHLAGAHGFKPL